MTDAPRGANERRRPDRAALVIGLGLAVLAAVVAWNTRNIGGGGGYAQIGPKAFPYAIAIMLAVLSAGTLLSAWRGEFPARDRDDIPPILWIVGGLAAQLLLLPYLGFSIATGLLFAATARGFGRGPLWFTVPLGIVLSFAVFLVFRLLLKLALPAGPLENLIV